METWLSQNHFLKRLLNSLCVFTFLRNQRVTFAEPVSGHRARRSVSAPSNTALPSLPALYRNLEIKACPRALFLFSTIAGPFWSLGISVAVSETACLYLNKTPLGLWKGLPGVRLSGESGHFCRAEPCRPHTRTSACWLRSLLSSPASHGV